MSIEAIEGVLARVPVFSELGDELRRTLAEVAALESYGDGDVLFREGDPGDKWYVVATGHVRIVRDVGEGGDGHIVLTTLGPGDSFGEVSVFDAQPRSATALASGELELVAIERRALLGLLEARPAEVARLLASIIGTLSGTVRRATNDLVTVYETGKAAGSLRDLDELGRRVVGRVHGAVGADRTSLGIWDPFTDDYHWVTEGGDVPTPESLEELGGLIDRAFEAGEALVVTPESVGWLGRSAVVVPVWNETEGLGVLVCCRDGDTPLGPDQQRVASIVALQVGGAIAIARRDQEARDRERLQRAREGLGEIG